MMQDKKSALLQQIDAEQATKLVTEFVQTLEEEVERRTRELRQSEERYKFLLQISNAINTSFSIDEIFKTVVQSIRTFFVFDRASIVLVDESGKVLRFFALEPEQRDILGRNEVIPVEGSAIGWVVRNGRVRTCSDLSLKQEYYEEKLLLKTGVRSYILVPLIFRGKVIGTFNLASRNVHQYDTDDIRFLEQIAEQITVAVGSAKAYTEIARLKDALAEENIYLRDEIRLVHPFHEIVGRSQSIQRVLQDVERVAKTDTTVLLRGETGTGKELIARAIHSLSPRNTKSLIKVNCSALSESLIASELFGHEKGAFTGADRRKPGRFELANGGTIFLDEIGEIPPEIQVKILRVLQEKEIERVGGTETIKVNVRVIASTNRDLETAIASGDFRDDLYYRLNVFPIVLPPLREHKEDIEPLTEHFVKKYAKQMNKQITRIGQKTLQIFLRYHWPGKLLFTRAGTVRETLPSTIPSSFDDGVRELITRALDVTSWKIYGEDGAAKMLKMKPTTLQAKMKKLGIRRPATPTL
jgi:formate hydrogenlyase transcriptional activator